MRRGCIRVVRTGVAKEAGMRKIAILSIAAAMLAVAVGPAEAGKPIRTRSANLSANAFWYSIETISPTSYRSSVWYVGVYQSSEETFSDLYFDTSICEVTPPEDTCTPESSRYGFSDLSGQTFTIDAKSLSASHLDATYDLQEYDADFNPVGDPVATHIVTDWTGIGSLFREKSSYSVQTPCGLVRYTSKGVNRSAEATGSVDGLDLGETYDAYLASGASRSFEPTC
jgi:hypothetical protein